MGKINKEEDLNLPYELRSVETHPRRPVDLSTGRSGILPGMTIAKQWHVFAPVMLYAASS